MTESLSPTVLNLNVKSNLQLTGNNLLALVCIAECLILIKMITGRTQNEK